MERPQRKIEIVKETPSQLAPTHSKAIALTAQHYQTMVAFVKVQMQKEIDYGTIPGTNKPTLLKPGAEKLCRLFSLRPSYQLIDYITDFDKPLFHYHYRCSLIKSGEMVGQGDGNCNSMENKYKKQQYKVFDLTNTICCLGARSLAA